MAFVNSNEGVRPQVKRAWSKDIQCTSPYGSTALLNSANDWYLKIDQRKYTGLIFVDLKKAFDMVDNEILLKILKIYLVTGLEYDWFEFCLDNRKTFGRIGGTSSDVKRILCGVPQGSCLGSLLFMVYIYDLPP